MRIHHVLLWLFVPAFLVLAACGGDDDEEGPGFERPTSSGSANGGATRPSNSSGKADVPKVKDGVFGNGTLHLEVSGGKDLKVDVPGNGITSGGYTVLTFGSAAATVIIAFQPDDAENPGAISVTASNVSTAGEWGKGCTVKVDDGAKELKGDFTCKDIEGVDPKNSKDFTVNIKGNFSLPREK
jgi:hypothetical protein